MSSLIITRRDLVESLSTATPSASFVIRGGRGPRGLTGNDGVGVPTGGTTGQVLGKASDADLDTEWVDQTGGGGGGAPTNASYVVIGANASLTAERVLTAGAGVTITDAGANNAVTLANSDRGSTAITSFKATPGTVTGAITLGDTTVTGTLDADTIQSGNSASLPGVFQSGPDGTTGVFLDATEGDPSVSVLAADIPRLTASNTGGALAGVWTAATATGGTNNTQIASTAFVTAAVSAAVSGLLELKGNLDCSANPNYPAGSVGDTYYVSVAGKVGGASGVSVDVGDAVVCKTDNAGGTQAAVGTSWFVLEHNLAGALLSANNLSDLASVATARTNLGVPAGSGTSTGTNTGDQTSVSGNAGTATALQTGRAINGVTFDGTAAITVASAAGTLTGATLAANVLATSITSVGTLTGGATGAGFTVALGTSTLTGTLPAAQMPALTGDVTTSAGAVATTLATTQSAVHTWSLAQTFTVAPVFTDAVGTRAAAGFVTLTTIGTTGSVTIDCSGQTSLVLSLTGNVTLSLSNEADGRRFTLFVRGQASGYTVTWWSGLKWPGGAAPTIPTVSGRVLPIGFVRLASGEWLGIPGTECY